MPITVTAKAGGAHTSGWANSWDGAMNYTCPHNKVMCGLESYHDNRKEDRRFKVKCCSLTSTAKA
eukprot:gene12721-21265_t